MPWREITIKRYENKYLIPADLCEEIRDYVTFFCYPDSHSPTNDGRYTVHSLYFDTPDLRFYFDNRTRVHDRVKARVRYFGGTPRDFAWMEVKRKINRIVWKTRERIPVSAWPDILDSPVLLNDNRGRRLRDGRVQRTLDNFINVIDEYGAGPMVHVRYLREAYISEIDNYARVTFDRRLRGCLAESSTELAVQESEMSLFDDAASCTFDQSPVVFEIKCERFVPRWILELVERFRLIQRGFSKYCNAVDHGLEGQCVNPEMRVTDFWARW